ncbi:MAG: 16S rRNA (cytidine(1402)-2'-O)-methyltransferase, partial [Bacteroidota bacterium]
TLEDIQTYFGKRRVVVARELTKKFEEITRGPIESVLTDISGRQPRGEYVVIVEGASNDAPVSHSES